MKKIFQLVIIFFFLSCNNIKKTSNYGYVVYKHRLFNLQTKQEIFPAYERDRKAWYKDSFVIGEGSHVNIESDTSGKEIWNTFIGEYTFMDLPNRSYYEYKNFSDTAFFFDSYYQKPGERQRMGWNFFSSKQLFNSDSLNFINDTVIENVVYKRIRQTRIIEITNKEEQKFLGERQVVIETGYLRNDVKGLIFSMDKQVEKKVGYNLVRYDSYSPTNNSYLISRIEVYPNKLSKEELKVFNAWEKNAKNNPVKK